MRSVLGFLCACWIMWSPLATAAQQGRDATGRQAYYQGLNLVRAGELEPARKVLEQLLVEMPDDPFADDALLELARMAEEEEGRPDQALKDYRRLLKRYPESRLARRAQARARFLETNLGGAPERLARYQKLLRRGGKRPVGQVEAELRALLKEDPYFKLAPEGLLWLAGRWAAAGQPERARAVYGEIVANYPEHKAAPTSLLALAELARGEGQLERAEGHYARLAHWGDGSWLQAAEEGRRRLGAFGLRRNLTWLGLVLWGLAALLLWGAVLVLGRRGSLEAGSLKCPPPEALLLLLLMGGLLWLTHGRAQQAHHALWWLAGASMLLILPNAVLMRSLRLRGPVMVLWCLGLCLAWAAAVLGSVGLAGMLGQVAHTFAHGVG